MCSWEKSCPDLSLFVALTPTWDFLLKALVNSFAAVILISNNFRNVGIRIFCLLFSNFVEEKIVNEPFDGVFAAKSVLWVLRAVTRKVPSNGFLFNINDFQLLWAQRFFLFFSLKHISYFLQKSALGWIFL